MEFGLYPGAVLYEDNTANHLGRFQPNKLDSFVEEGHLKICFGIFSSNLKLPFGSGRQSL